MRTLADTFGIPLVDRDLAKIGVLAALEAKAKFLIMATLKAVAGYKSEQFICLEKQQLAQLVAKLLTVTPTIDSALHDLVAEFDRVRIESHEVRHKFVHALWASGDADSVVGRDIRRAESLAPADLDDAMIKVAQLAQAAHACAFRAAQLIVAGVLQEGEDAKPAMFLGGRWVNL